MPRLPRWSGILLADCQLEGVGRMDSKSGIFVRHCPVLRLMDSSDFIDVVCDWVKKVRIYSENQRISPVLKFVLDF
jgi:hypothetical protein